MSKRKRLDEMSQKDLEEKLKTLRSRRAQAPPSTVNGLRRHLWRAEKRVVKELDRRHKKA